MRKQLLPLIALSLLVFQSCKKDDDNPPPTNSPAALKHFVKTIEWDLGVTGTVSYNTDSTIKSIAYVGLGTGSQTDYTWTGKQLTTVSLATSLYKNTFTYNNGLMTRMVNEYRDLTTPSGYKYDYTYTSAGQLKEFKYSRVNEAGTTALTNTVYTYKANGDFDTVVVTQLANNLVIKYSIDSWSAEIEIHPWLFISTTLSEYHHIYNYPVLSKLKKLPGKITQTVINPGGAPRVEKVTTMAYTISNDKRLDKTVTTLSYPGNPQLDQTQTTNFKY
ncbi:hypothetical protein [Paraflavitalea sp. CAU 1676]|uniref:hypothetical protein n=1 Tax=Paraflavitalea sp. CAU 1676 TaxID=3032598 RepID=UPI0023DBA454|nr:hypothetical protein [Paraflavitalea sp. CAU 1676]MDF2193552.1 hypothetical protein [Paraflavitalea sp. CAU 1676]